MNLLVASVVFFLMHRLISGGPLRPALAKSLGERAFGILFGLASAGVLGWMWLGFRSAVEADWGEQLYQPRLGILLLNQILQFAAISLIVLGVSTRNPTIAGMGAEVNRAGIARGVIRISRHPFLWGIVLFSVGHLLVEPHLAGLVFFGTLLVVALVGTRSIDAKRNAAFDKDWQAFARETSNIPFAAILDGRQRLAPREIGWLRLAAAILVFAVVLTVHPLTLGG